MRNKNSEAVDTKYKAKHHYQDTDVAETYDFTRQGSIKGGIFNLLQLRRIGKALNFVMEGSKVLDMPCGTGRVTEKIAQHPHRFEVYGGDISEEMMEVARRKLSPYDNVVGIRYIDGEGIDYADDEFECVTCIKLMPLIPPSVRVNILKELARISCMFVIVSYGYYTPWTKIVRFLKGCLRIDTLTRYPATQNNLRQELSAANLRIKKRYRTFRLFSEDIVLLLEV
jgi:SAM-dependent methyltransferase